MPLSTYTLTGDIADLVGGDVDLARVRAWIESNVGDQGVIFDRTNNALRAGDREITISPDGTFSVPGLIGFDNVDADVTPTNLQYRVFVSFPTARSRVQAVWNSGWFQMLADIDLVDVVPDQFVDPDYRGALVLQLEGIRDQALGFREDTRALRDETAALVVDDLGTTDAQSAALIGNNASLTYAALQARIDATANLVLMGVI